MRQIDTGVIRRIVSELCVDANINLRGHILSDLKKAVETERSGRARKVLRVLIKNAAIARHEGLAICQDTGMACVYLDAGQDVHLRGGNLEKAINNGVRDGYKKGYFRDSIVDPITRKNTGDGAPAVITVRITKGDKIRITVVPKGFGCENKSRLRMFKPTVELSEIKKFVVDTVKEAGPDACPPFVIGVGIGGTFEKAAQLSKEALLKKVTGHRSPVT
ncbi:MAG: fumarate hydratase, partial [Candidatus Omnitrophica bacterium]|nr:fumarate hydratase [Candidatus Omnitrophota bacterium]